MIDTNHDRFWSKANKTETCWIWMASKTSRGYGTYWFSGRLVKAHRHAYELLVGPIPEGLQLDHLCRVRNCVRPDHLEIVTNKENALRGESFAAFNSQKTHCPKGHELGGDNVIASHEAAGVRPCRICRNERALDWAKENRERLNARRRAHYSQKQKALIA